MVILKDDDIRLGSTWDSNGRERRYRVDTAQRFLALRFSGALFFLQHPPERDSRAPIRDSLKQTQKIQKTLPIPNVARWLAFATLRTHDWN